MLLIGGTHGAQPCHGKHTPATCAAGLRALLLPLQLLLRRRWEENDTPSNSILQRAVLNYINTYVDVLRQLPAGDLTLKKRALCEAAAKDGEEAKSESEDSTTNRNSEHAYDVNVAPPNNVWIEVKKGIRFRR